MLSKLIYKSHCWKKIVIFVKVNIGEYNKHDLLLEKKNYITALLWFGTILV